MINYAVYVLDISGCYYELAGTIYLKMDGKFGSFSDATNDTVKNFCDRLKINASARFLKLRDGMKLPDDQIGLKEMAEMERQKGLCFSYSPHQRSLPYV